MRRFLAPAFLALFAGSAHAAKAPSWPAIDPAELAEARPVLSPDAGVEANEWRIEVDDRNFPSSRQTSEYVRYKIFDPEKAADVTRVSGLSRTTDGSEVNEFEIRARLTLPDGTVREFGKESLQERPVIKRGAEESWLDRLLGSEGTTIREKFLAVSGIVPGAVLEYRTENTEHLNPLLSESVFIHNLQKQGISVRRLEYLHHVSSNLDYLPHVFMLNGAELHADFKPDIKHLLITVTAQDLPALVHEPFAGTVSDESLTLIGAYQLTSLRMLSRNNVGSVHTDPKDGSWSPAASLAHWVELDATEHDDKVARLAARLVDGAASETERARRIHDYVHAHYLEFLRRPRNEHPAPSSYNSALLADVISFEKNPDTQITRMDFIWLALALDREAGLKAQLILLPNRRTLIFDKRLVSAAFLPDRCIRVFADGGWKFSIPNTPDPIPFGRLPWWNQGGEGLIAQYKQQEFLPIPASPSGDSVIDNSGDFQLGADGTLAGKGTRTLTGEPATILRSRLRKAGDARRHNIVTRTLQDELKPAEVTTTRITGMDDPYAPLIIEYELKWPEFAVSTKSRMIFRPSIFHGQSKSPFAAETRRNLIEFPYHWQEIDHVAVQVPAGFKLESPSAPHSLPGDVVNYKIDLSYEPRHGLVHLTRNFDCNLTYVQARAYPALKHWFDSVANSDSHELVLLREPSAAQGPP